MKVLVIGLDGGDWQVFDPLMQRGRMPTLQRLTEEGTSGTLWSTIPDITPVAWSSFQTGLRPERHGALDFLSYGGANLINASTIKGKTIWEWASLQGKKIISLNVPVTFPPRPVDGIIVGGLFSPASSSDFVSPPEVADELHAATGGYTILEGQKVFRRHDVTQEDGLQAFVDAMVDSVKMRTRAGLALMERHPWDLCMVHLQEVDALQHPIWPFLDPESERFTDSAYSRVSTFYEVVDTCIRSLVERARADEDVTMIVMSDHGFQPTNRIVYLNRWLYQQGLLQLTGNLGSRLFVSLVQRAKALDPFELRRLLYRRVLPDSLKSSAYHNLEGGLGRIDRERSTAYAIFRAHRDFALLHVPSRDPATIEAVEQRLYDLVDPETGARVVKSIDSAANVYPKASPDADLPELVVQTNHGYAMSASFSDPSGPIAVSPQFGKEYGVGQHRREGIFVVNGPEVRRNYSTEAHIVDLAPTILHLMGLDVPTTMDGTVVHDVFAGPAADRPVRRLETDELISDVPRYEYSVEEEAEIKQRLRELGYLE